MRMRDTSWAVFAALLLCASAALAQDQKQDASPIDPNAPLQPLDANPFGESANRPPIGAARGGIGTATQEEAYDPSQVTPDRNTLSGLAPITLGSLQHSKNILDPAISFSQLGQTIPDASGNAVLTGISMASGSLNFNRAWSQYQFSAIYNGGETFNLGYGAATASFFGNTAPRYQFHDLMVIQQADLGRWHFLFQDNFTASPGAAFTSQGMGGPGLAAQFSSMLGASLTGFAQSFQPFETIDTGSIMRYRNSILAQAEYSFSRRSAVTYSASYGLLDFSGTGYFNSTLMELQGGYDYLLDPANSIAVLGSFGKINYTGTAGSTTATGSSTTDYMGALAYGRKVTGRLAFQVAAGPQEILAEFNGGVNNFDRLFASVNSALTYQRRRSGVSFNYMRGLTEGSGVFLGATSNTLSASANRQFTRNWTGTVNGGYSLNNSLAPAGVATTQFDNWFVGANIGRRLGPYAQVNFNYGLQRQNSPVTCPVVSCGGTGLQQTFGMSVNWHLRPAG